MSFTEGLAGLEAVPRRQQSCWSGGKAEMALQHSTCVGCAGTEGRSAAVTYLHAEDACAQHVLHFWVGRLSCTSSQLDTDPGLSPALSMQAQHWRNRMGAEEC